LQKEFGMAVIFVTHDGGVAVEVSDRVAVMYAGRFIETGSVRDIIRNPRHPYSQGLLAANVLPGGRPRPRRGTRAHRGDSRQPAQHGQGTGGLCFRTTLKVCGRTLRHDLSACGCGQRLASGALHSRLNAAAARQSGVAAVTFTEAPDILRRDTTHGRPT